MTKRIIARIIFILYFLYSLYSVILTFGDRGFKVFFELITLLLLVIFSFLYKGTSKKVRTLFSLYVALDIFSGFSYFINAHSVRNLFIPFPSNAWIFAIIYILKFSQYQLFKLVASTTLLWIGYIFEYLSLRDNEI